VSSAALASWEVERIDRRFPRRGLYGRGVALMVLVVAGMMCASLEAEFITDMISCQKN